MGNSNNILLVEDSEANALVYQAYLQPKYTVMVASDGRAAIELFKQQDFQLVILDVQLPDINGLEVLKLIRQNNADLPVIVITAHGSVDIALNAMKLGANDFLSKPFDKARIEVTINNLLQSVKLSSLVKQYESKVKRDRFENMIGNSLAMQNVYHIIQSAAPSKATVFITGESGTGKELCAEAIHNCSQRKSQPFIALNCAAIPHDLIESEIFGHMKGAFTGASSARQGAAALAHQGTLFLDEIGEMPLALQSKLLRFIQTGRFQPVGGSKEIETDIRFVCATNREPLTEVKAGRFREDLYYRLNVIPIHMPALRERKKDCLLIANNLLAEMCKDEMKQFIGFDEQVKGLILSYPWPGNVRELGNVIRNIVVLNDGEYVGTNMLPQSLLDHARLTPSFPQVRETDHPLMNQPNSIEAQNDQSTSKDIHIPLPEESGLIPEGQIQALWLAEKHYIEMIIAKCHGNITQAAALLEISPSTIYRKKLQWEEYMGAG